MKSPPKKRKGFDVDAMDRALIRRGMGLDGMSNNDKIATMLELVQRNLELRGMVRRTINERIGLKAEIRELRERVQELETALTLMVEIVRFCYKSKSIPGPDIPPEVTKALRGDK